MLVSDILRGKGTDVVTVAPTTDLTGLLALLTTHRIGAVVVSSDGRTVEGIVSERDVVRVLAADGADGLLRSVGEICTRDITTATPQDRLEDLAQVMTDGHFRHLPVLVDGALAGIVSIGDVVKFRLAQLEDERQALQGYITGG